MLEDRLNQDLKQAMLAGDKFVANALRTLKSVILYAKVADGTRGQAMPDAAVVALLQKEAKKRQESADLFRQGGREEKAQDELAEKALIERYLPAQLGEDKIAQLVDDSIAELGGAEQATMGAVIAEVRQKTAGTADGALIAQLVRKRLQP